MKKYLPLVMVHTANGDLEVFEKGMRKYDTKEEAKAVAETIKQDMLQVDKNRMPTTCILEAD